MMVDLRCNSCKYLQDNYCLILKEVLPNGLAKLHYGGAIGVYSGGIEYRSKCGLKENVKPEIKENIEFQILDSTKALSIKH